MLCNKLSSNSPEKFAHHERFGNCVSQLRLARSSFLLLYKTVSGLSLQRPIWRSQHHSGTIQYVLKLAEAKYSVNIVRRCVVELISALLDRLNAGERLPSYIDLPKRLECSASCPDRLCCLQATSRLPRGAWGSLGELIFACSGGDEWRDLKREFWVSAVCRRPSDKMINVHLRKKRPSLRVRQVETNQNFSFHV
jgi:hypothetical protein